MELRDLRYFLTLASEASLSKAAQRLGLSQSTLSKSLARLESSCGATLVQRMQRGVELTEQGQIVLRHAERVAVMTADVHSALGASRRLPQPFVRLGVGLGDLGDAETLALARFVARVPDTRIDIVQSSAEALSAALSRGEVDCVLGPPPQVVPPDHAVTPLGSETYAAVCSRQHPRRRQLRSLAALVQERWVVAAATTRVGLWLAGLAQQRGLPLPQVALRCDGVPTLLSTIAHTDCVGYLSHAMVRAHPLRSRLAVLQIEEIRHVKTMAFISRTHNADLPAVRTLRELAAAAARSSAPAVRSAAGAPPHRRKNAALPAGGR